MRNYLWVEKSCWPSYYTVAAIGGKLDHLDASKTGGNDELKDLRDKLDGGTWEFEDKFENKYDVAEETFGKANTRVDSIYHFILGGFVTLLAGGVLTKDWKGSPDDTKKEKTGIFRVVRI
ncbi:hypothetical protein HOY82DRAFT_600378 [Tuber indicum]|nr:hypothetical protein HOY82DRAFT_600378 [Tuber indicum]